MPPLEQQGPAYRGVGSDMGLRKRARGTCGAGRRGRLCTGRTFFQPKAKINFDKTSGARCTNLQHDRRGCSSRRVLVQHSIAGKDVLRDRLINTTLVLVLSFRCQTEENTHHQAGLDALVLPYSSAGIYGEADVRRTLVLGVLRLQQVAVEELLGRLRPFLASPVPSRGSVDCRSGHG